jgi:hypothetical protein
MRGSRAPSTCCTSSRPTARASRTPTCGERSARRMTIVVVIAAVLALAAALRRLARIAVALIVIALALGTGPTVFASLEDLGAALPGGPEQGSGATKPRTVDGDTFTVNQDYEPKAALRATVRRAEARPTV